MVLNIKVINSLIKRKDGGKEGSRRRQERDDDDNDESGSGDGGDNDNDLL
jgi:hypothetical protein